MSASTQRSEPPVLNLTSTHVLSHIDAGVHTLTLSRLDKKNALTASMYADLAQALAYAAANSAIHAVVMQGHESVFSAGNDLAEFATDPPQWPDAPVFAFLSQLSQFPKPLVAAVCGPAVGIGTTMLLHCDLVYAGDNAAFAMPFVNLGLCPEAASSLLAPQRMGYLRAAQALLLGEPFTAETALEMGLVNRVVTPGEAHALAQQQALKLAAKPLQALMETKRLLKKIDALATTQRIAEEAASFGRLLQEPAAQKALGAFLGKK